MADESMETNQEQNGVSNDDDRKLFVGGLSWNTTEDELRSYMEKYGTVVKCTLKTDPGSMRSRGFGFVVFEDSGSLDKVLAETNHYLGEKKIDPKRANPMGKEEPPAKKIYVGKVSPTTSEDQITEYFGQWGTVVKVEAPFDKQNNVRKNFVFVEFDSTETVNKVLGLTEEDPEYKHQLGTDEVEIKRATPSQRTRGGRGGFRGGDRGRGGRGGWGGGWDQGYNQGYGGGYGNGYGGYGGYGGGYDGYGGGYGGYGGYGGGYDYSGWGGYGGGYGNYYGYGQYDNSGGWGGGWGNYDSSGQQSSGYGKAPKNARGGGGGGGGGGQGYRPY